MEKELLNIHEHIPNASGSDRLPTALSQCAGLTVWRRACDGRPLPSSTTARQKERAKQTCQCREQYPTKTLKQIQAAATRRKPSVTTGRHPQLACRLLHHATKSPALPHPTSTFLPFLALARPALSACAKASLSFSSTSLSTDHASYSPASLAVSFGGADLRARRGVPDNDAAAERDAGPLRAGELVAVLVRREATCAGFLSFLAVSSLVERWWIHCGIGGKVVSKLKQTICQSRHRTARAYHQISQRVIALPVILDMVAH